MAHPAPPSDDGSPARLIATMVGIVGILLLGSLAWSAVGALISAIGAAGSALSTSANPPPVSLQPAIAVTATPVVLETPTLVSPPPTEVSASPTGVGPSPTAVAATPTVAPVATPSPAVAGRNPWILLPQPEPGARVPPGATTLEARARGDVPISTIQLELDGTALPVRLEQRSESTWRGFSSARVAAGQHNVRAVVTDADGRTGSFRWSFTAGSGP